METAARARDQAVSEATACGAERSEAATPGPRHSRPATVYPRSELESARPGHGRAAEAILSATERAAEAKSGAATVGATAAAAGALSAGADQATDIRFGG